MALTLVLVSLLAAPRAPRGADEVVYVPRLDAVAHVLPFFEAAGARSTLLHPSSWKHEAHPLLGFDITDQTAMTRVGLDVAGSLTRARLGDALMVCVGVADVEAYRKAVSAALARLGEPFEKKEGAVLIAASRDPIGRVLGAYALVGGQSCAVAGHGRSVEALFPLLARTLSHPEPSPPIAARLTGPVQWWSSSEALSVNSSQLTLSAELWSKRAPGAFAGPGNSPVGACTAQGMGVVRGRWKSTQMPALVGSAMNYFPGADGLRPAAQQLARLLTGNLAVVLSHVQVASGLRTSQARFFALKAAVVLEVSDPLAVDVVLQALPPQALVSREGTLEVTRVGRLLVVSNNAEVHARVLAALPSAGGRQAHGLELVGTPGLMARALAQIPLMEALSAPELAGLVAVGTELGPLLKDSTRVSAWLDSSGPYSVGHLTWELSPPSHSAADAGR